MDPLLEAALPLRYDSRTGLAVPEVAVSMVFLTVFLDVLAATISTPALPYFAKEFGASNAEIGYLFAAWSLTSTLCAPPLSALSDRIGRKRVLLMALAGAGLANVGQASAPSYAVLLAWRAFSGVWAAVYATAQVYLADVCSPAVLPTYMSKLSGLSGAAMVFGPGLGGGLSKFGLNFPILADGLVSLAAATLVLMYLPESPLWSSTRRAESGPEQTPVPRGAYLLGTSGFLFGIAFGTRVSMQVVSLQAKLGFDALQVGYLYVAFALTGLIQNYWVTPRLQSRYGLFAVGIVATLLQAAFAWIGFAWVEGIWPCLACLVIANVTFQCRTAINGPLAALFSDSTNRGAVFGTVQMMTNFGRLVGPLVAGNLAVKDPIGLPWVFAGACGVGSAAILPVLRPKACSCSANMSNALA